MISKGQVNFPSLSKSENNIIGGQKSDEVAHDCIHSADKDKSQISEVSIPSNLQKSLFGSKECLIGSIVEECGKIHIYFPRNKSGDSTAIIRGPMESVEKAKKKLLQLGEEEKAKNYSMALPVKSPYHHILISKNGGKLHKVFETAGTHVVLPALKNKNQELITVIRTKAAGKDGQKEQEVLSKDLQNMVEDSMLINRKFHHFFVMYRGQLLRQMSEVYGDISFTFSYEGKENIRITMKGEKGRVQASKKHIQRIFEPLGSHITVQYAIPQKFSPFFLGPMYSRVRQIARYYKVQIKFLSSKNPSVNIDPVGHKTGKERWQNINESDSSSLRICQILHISGQVENCHAVVEALDSLVLVTDEVHVPFHLHPHIIRNKGSGIQKLINELKVYMTVTKFGGNSDTISIMGLDTDVEQAKIRLQRQIEALQKKIDNQISRNFKIKFSIDPKYRLKITGYTNLLITQICTEHDVTVHLPKKGSNDMQDQIIITGYKENAIAARDAIMRMVQKIEKTVSKDVPLNPHVRGDIFGFGGRSIHKIMSKFQVDIRLPPRGSWHRNITVIGLPDNVKGAIDHFLNLEKQYLSTNTKCEPQVKHLKCNSLCSVDIESSKGLVKKDVPCNAETTANPPDMENSKDHPEMENLKDNPKMENSKDDPKMEKLKDNPKLKQQVSSKTHPWRP